MEFHCLGMQLESVYEVLNGAVSGPLYWSGLSKDLKPSNNPQH